MQESMSSWDALQEKCPHVIDMESGKDLESARLLLCPLPLFVPSWTLSVTNDTGMGSFKWMGPLPTRSLSGSPHTSRGQHGKPMLSLAYLPRTLSCA